MVPECGPSSAQPLQMSSFHSGTISPPVSFHGWLSKPGAQEGSPHSTLPPVPRPLPELHLRDAPGTSPSCIPFLMAALNLLALLAGLSISGLLVLRWGAMSLPEPLHFLTNSPQQLQVLPPAACGLPGTCPGIPPDTCTVGLLPVRASPREWDISRPAPLPLPSSVTFKWSPYERNLRHALNADSHASPSTSEIEGKRDHKSSSPENMPSKKMGDLRKDR